MDGDFGTDFGLFADDHRLEDCRVPNVRFSQLELEDFEKEERWKLAQGILVLSQFSGDLLDPFILQSILLEDGIQLTKRVPDLVHALSLGDQQLRLSIR